jgi:hypothetical protein
VIRKLFLPVLVEGTALVAAPSGWAGQAPAASSDPDIPLSHRERVYAAGVRLTKPFLRAMARAPRRGSGPGQSASGIVKFAAAENLSALDD